MEKVYVVMESYTNADEGINEYNLSVFSTYEKAKEHFNKVKEKIKSYDLGYNYCEDDEDYYCEWESGEYLYFHGNVSIMERKVQ